MLRLPQAQKAGARDRSAGEVEGAPGFGRGQAAGLGVAPHRGEGREVDPRQRQVRRGIDRLHRPVRPLQIPGAQGLVPARRLAERPCEAGRSERAVEVDGERHVVARRPRLQPVEEPEPLLREREGEGAAPQCGDEGRERRPHFPLSGAQPRDLRGQSGRGRRAEEKGDRHVDAEDVAHPRRQAGGEQRVAAQSEEVVVRAGGTAEELCPDPRQHLLERRAG